MGEKSREKQREQRRMDEWNKQHRIINSIDYKLCNICNEWFPSTAEYFYKNKANGIDGLFPYCKKCTIKKSYRWGEENKGKKKAFMKKEDSKPHSKERTRRWSKIRRLNGEHKKWQSNNTDKLKKYRENHNNHTITDKEWASCKNYFNYECAYCGISEQEAKSRYNQLFHKEHVDHSGLDDLSNCVPSCKGCNSSKWTFDIEDWYNESNKVFDKGRKEKILKWLNEDYKLYSKK